MTSGIAEHTRMRAAVLTGPGRFTIEEVASPAAGPGEVRIRMEGCGVCASNLTPWAGPEWMDFRQSLARLGMRAGAWWTRRGGCARGVGGDRVAALSYQAMPSTI